jgi:uncharacterized protein
LKVGNQYIIPFRGLNEGEHNFDFQIGKAFFEENSALNIENGEINSKIVVNKKANFLVLDVTMNGAISLQCDRCLEEFSFQVDFHDQLYVKFKEELEEPDINVIFVHPSEDLLDLHQYFFDSIGLSIPIQKVHPDNENGEPTCDTKMISILNAHSSQETQGDNEDIDPRWSKLKGLLNERNKNE